MNDRTITGVICFLDRLDAANTVKRGDKHNEAVRRLPVEEWV